MQTPSLNNKKVVGRFNTIKLINDASTIEPRIEYGTDGQPYRLFMSGGRVVPDILQGWRYEERSEGEWIKNAEKWDITNPPYYCSECGHSNNYKANFCEECGAKMR